MSTKQHLPNQHLPLHIIYGQDDCCLCKTENYINTLEMFIAEIANADVSKHRYISADLIRRAQDILKNKNLLRF